MEILIKSYLTSKTALTASEILENKQAEQMGNAYFGSEFEKRNDELWAMANCGVQSSANEIMNIIINKAVAFNQPTQDLRQINISEPLREKYIDKIVEKYI